MTEWTLIAADSDVVEGAAFPSEYAGVAIALYRLDGEVYAIGDICPHEDVRLSEGWIADGSIECPLHQSCFEIRTGKCIEGGPAYEDVERFETRVDAGQVFVRAIA